MITNYVRSNSFILVHKSFYNEAKRPDSIIVLEITKLDSAYQYVSIDYFQYEFDDLKKLKSETLFSDDRIYKELFFYNEQGQLDSTAWFRNLKREFLGDKRVDSLILWETKKYSYDQSGRKTTVKYWGGSYETFEYNADNQLFVKVSSPFRYQNGCSVGKEAYYKTETYFYNDKALISKVVTKKYKLRKNEKWRRVYRGAARYIYEYYGL